MIILFIFIFAWKAESSSSLDQQGLTHLASSAQTLGAGRFAYRPYPGSSALTDYSSFLGGFSVGLTDYFEIGTVPLLLAADNSELKSESFFWKARLYRSEETVWSVGTHYWTIQTKKLNPGEFDIGAIRITEMGVGFEKSLSLDWDLIVNANGVLMTLDRYPLYKVYDEIIIKEDYPINSAYSLFVDFRQKISSSRQWTFGISRGPRIWMNFETHNLKDIWGVGLSHGWKNLKGWISSVSLGAHLLEGNRSKMLFSLNF